MLLSKKQVSIYTSLKNKIMNLKRILSTTYSPWYWALIYAAVLLMNTSGGNQDIKALIIYGYLGLIFFTSGISLVRTTKRILNNIKIWHSIITVNCNN
jgi:predicted Na+-dependent transporter